MLAFKVADLPEMPRGKGNKIYDIPGKKAAAREEYLTGVAVVPPGGQLVLWSGDKQKTLEWKELADYRGQRAQRGAVLTRGWRSVDRLEAVVPAPPADKEK
jgi:topoisomerase-4 subunit A